MTDHAALARGILASFDPGTRPAEAAMAHATLALTEEQRTANLIAARLGLTPTTPNQEQ